MSEGQVYGSEVVKVEPYGTEHIGRAERHGTPRSLFTLWFASNVTIGSFAVGYLSVSAFGLPLDYSVIIFLIANIVGAAFLGLVSATGPVFGYPQMIISRAAFGRRGGYLPATFQWVSSLGWFTVNAVLGSFALSSITGLGYVPSAVLLVSLMVLVGIFGHNFIHRLELVMSVVLGIFFVLMTVILLFRGSSLLAYHPSVPAGSYYFIPFAILLAGSSLSYLMSWGPYASDYSRYLPENTSMRKSFLFTFAGGMIASFWSEFVGALVAAYVYGNVTAPSSVGITASFPAVLGPLGTAGLISVVLGTLAANALNIYTSGLSFMVLDLKLKRWKSVILGGCIGGALTVIVGSTFTSFYEGFLLLLDYWVTPWLAIMIIDFYVLRVRNRSAVENARAFGTNALVSYAAGLICSIPFISWSYGSLSYTGFLATELLRGGDISYYIAFAITSSLYYFLSTRSAKEVHARIART